MFTVHTTPKERQEIFLLLKKIKAILHKPYRFILIDALKTYLTNLKGENK